MACSRAALFGALLLFGLASTARASTVVTWTGQDSFNTNSIFFAGFYANELTGISGLGYYQGNSGNHGTTNFSLQLLIYNPTAPIWQRFSWTTIDTWTVPHQNPQPHYLLADLSTPITFNLNIGELITGIRFLSSPDFGADNYQSFRGFTGEGDDDDGHCGERHPCIAEKFTFDDPPVVTPLPAALPLFAGGVGVVGFFAHRRKRKTQTEISPA